MRQVLARPRKLAASKRGTLGGFITHVNGLLEPLAKLLLIVRVEAEEQVLFVDLEMANGTVDGSASLSLALDCETSGRLTLSRLPGSL